MTEFKEISVEQAKLLVANENPLIIDVRDAHSYKEQHIEGAMRSHGELTEHLIRGQQFTKPVLVYCYHGNSSKDYALILARAGFTNCYSLQGGFTAWKKSANQSVNLSENTLSDSVNEWLEAKGLTASDINAENEQMLTPLMLAAAEGNDVVVNELINAGADIEVQNGDGNTALWLACFGGNQKSIQYLIDAGANLDHQNPDGVTPLMYASSAGKTEIVKQLVEAGASTSLHTKDDFSALDLASNIDILRF